ncbi:TrbI/VirB10 family protein (plasmid) [Burkholderia cenocepacia]|uniref:TrbI/VirB10 family protein n=1 Tax=Burkholderia cenocepacia TaxID=95486 RepID=UPI00209CFD17|nr:TrbI/VirB10 family protein [Burkholderia cenocepacia]MCO8402815.1 TrbI/VirB10 family protein [Burkholderia cenocepacia]MCO8415054.1 TrbI/VirB10 family protein [Burkholderia cenocepacia]MCO8423050.1 TrbI/VirB10 family protein [Burkholderia cenocepacia]MCO8474801.1 TrbI/VirB10 family protein [Burkholderia cenocepacia]MCO8482019.1 TrbI/VirB10 family protein [Burkholderia cenocepacia]
MNAPLSPIEEARKGQASRKLLLWAMAALLLLAAILIIIMVVQQPSAKDLAEKKQQDQAKNLAKQPSGSSDDIAKIAQMQEARVTAEKAASEANAKYKNLLAQVNGAGAASGASVPSANGVMSAEQLAQYQKARDNTNPVTEQDAEKDLVGWTADTSQLQSGTAGSQSTSIAGLPSPAELAANGAGNAQSQRDQSLALLASLKGGSAPSRSTMSQWDDAAGNEKTPSPAFPDLATSPDVLHQGTSIPLATTRAINSDIPGELEARVVRDVYDTIDTSRLVLPMGTRVIGPYNSDLIPGQSRLQGGFTRMIFPNGNWINIAGSQLSDRLGEGGLGGEVNYHLWRSLALQFAVAGIAKVTKIDNAGGSGGVSLYGGSTSSTAGQILTNTMQSFNQQFMNLKATITVKPGTEFTVTLSRDLILPPAITVKRTNFSAAARGADALEVAQ